MSDSNIHLDGIEVSVIKALGLSGSDLNGEDLMDRCSDLLTAELIDTLKGLITMGYVVADRDSFHSADDVKAITFRVNSGYIKDLREALNPRQEKPKSKRVRRE